MTGSPHQTILIIDDEFVMIEVLEMLLADEGYRVLTAADGEEGLELMQVERPDLVITDYMMPKLSGPKLVERMVADERLAGIPVIMMSGGYTHERPTHVRAFFRKPPPVDDLLRTVAELLGPPTPEP